MKQTGVFWPGAVTPLLVQGLITLAISTGLIALPHYQFFYDSSIVGVVTHEIHLVDYLYSSFGIFCFVSYLGSRFFWCGTKFVSTRYLLALAALFS